MVLVLLPRRLQEKLLMRLPDTMTVYPFEAFLAAAAFLSAVPILLGLARSDSINVVLPRAFSVGWSLGLMLAGGTLAVGLAFHSLTGLITTGLRLLGMVFVVYGVTVLVHIGSDGYFPALTVMLVGVLCWTRALYLQATARIIARVREVADQDDP